MKVLLTGGTGFIGRKIIKKLSALGHEFVLLSRNAQNAKARLKCGSEVFEWNPEAEFVPEQALKGIDAVIHLAGEGIADKRWSGAQKEKIYNSRVLGTRNLIQSLLKYDVKPKVIISASAIGIYGDRGEEELTESSAVGRGFLARVCRDWEWELFKHKAEFERLVSLRIGIVLGLEGGALPKMLLPFKLGLGGPVGKGKQWMSWIHVDDLVALIEFSLLNSSIQGPVNAVSPHAVTNKVFSKTLGRALHRPSLLSVPPFVLKIILGELSTLLIEGQKVLPQKALKHGFEYQFNRLQQAFQSLLSLK
jgi:uncharacterized protein